MWKKTKCFTLMELLVVVAVIALLLAVLMPSLRKAKEMAGRIVCANHERQLSTANNLYANQWDEQLCPPMMVDGDMPVGPPGDPVRYRKKTWLTNTDFQKFMGLDDTMIVDWAGALVMPDEYFCPADKVARYDQLSAWDVLVSYAHNVSDWNNATQPPDYSRHIQAYFNYTTGLPPAGMHKWLIGHKRTAIPRASEKLVFTDSSDWWCTWEGANFVQGWDAVGHASWTEYAAVNIYGPVLYRHNEGANVCFYDGHVDHMAKEKVYIDKGGGGDPPEEDGTLMWFVIPTWP